jgi:hypothetical protein
VHALLRHLAAAGFDGAPRVLGIDAQGREVLSYLEGEVPAYPVPAHLWSDQAAQGDPAFRQFLAEGHVDGYRRDLRFIESIRADLTRALARPPGGPPGPGPGRRTP